MNEIEKELENRKRYLEWMYNNKIFNFHEVGKLISLYYKDKKRALEMLGGTTENNKTETENRINEQQSADQ